MPARRQELTFHQKQQKQVQGENPPHHVKHAPSLAKERKNEMARKRKETGPKGGTNSTYPDEAAI